MKKFALQSRLLQTAAQGALSLCFVLGLLVLAPVAAQAEPYDMGLKLYTQGDYATASRYFLEAVRQGDDNPNVHYYLADSYLKLNRLAEAQAEYQKILALSPNSQAARLSRLGLANLRNYMNNVNGERWRRAGGSGSGPVKDQYSGAPITGEDYLDSITENGRRVRWALSKMPLKVYIEQAPVGIRNFQPAFINDVRRGLDVWCGVLGNQLSYALISNKDEADIRISWTNAIDTRGHNGDGGTAYTAGLMIPHIRDDRLDYMEVKIATFDIHGQPQSSDIIYAVAIHELGHSLGLLGHSDNAGDIMYAENQHVTQPSGRDMNTLRKLYTLAADVNNLDPASRPVELSRNDELAKAADESLARLEAQAKKDGMALTYLNLSVAYFQKGQQVTLSGGDAKPWYEKALVASNEAIQREPKDPRAYHKRSLVYQELGNYGAALQDIQKSVTFDRKEPEYLMLQSWYLAKLGRLAEARGSLDAYLLASPASANSSDVQRIREALNQGSKS